MVSNLPLIIPHCQVAEANVSNINKLKVLEGVIKRQEKTAQRKQRQRQHQSKSFERKSCEEFFFFFRKRPYGVEKRFDVSSHREHSKELRCPHRDEDPRAPWDQRAQH